MELVFTADNPVNAHLFANYLSAHGLHPKVQRDELWTLAVEVLTTPGVQPSVWVDERELAQAQKLLKHYQDGPPNADLYPWDCEHCHERNDAGFLQCWHCGQFKK